MDGEGENGWGGGRTIVSGVSTIMIRDSLGLQQEM